MPEKQPDHSVFLMGILLIFSSFTGEAMRLLMRKNKMPFFPSLVTFIVNVIASILLGIIAACFLFDAGISSNSIAGIVGLCGYLGAATTENILARFLSHKCGVEIAQNQGDAP